MAGPGELPFDDDPATPRPLSVSELTASLKHLIEDSFGVVAVDGELSNCKQWSSGHLYFTLKDANAPKVLQSGQAVFNAVCMACHATGVANAVRDYVRLRMAEVAASTVNRELNLLSGIFRYARKEWGYPLPENPVHLVARPKVPSRGPGSTR